jgi:hypothetical protein
MRTTLMKTLVVLGIVVWASGPGPALAQADRPANEVLGVMPAAAALATGGTVPQVHVRWVAAASPTGDPVRAAGLVPLNRFEVVGRSALRGPLQRERDPQLSEYDLVIVSADAGGRETSWQKMQDPRIVRAELPGPTGQLSGEVLYRPEVELVAMVPDSATTDLHVYQAYWNGEQFVLRRLGVIAVAVR